MEEDKLAMKVTSVIVTVIYAITVAYKCIENLYLSVFDILVVCCVSVFHRTEIILKNQTFRDFVIVTVILTCLALACVFFFVCLWGVGAWSDHNSLQAQILATQKEIAQKCVKCIELSAKC